VRPDPDQARSWLEAELARPEYHQQSMLDRLVAWAVGIWDRLAGAAAGADPLSTYVAVGLALLMVVFAFVVVPRIRRTPAPSSDRRAVLRGEPATSREHRARAEAALARGHFPDAVVEAVRAIARDMVDRGVLADESDSTAHEIALGVGDAFPAQRGRLLAAADLFDAVQYGSEPASREQAIEMLAVHEELRRARPVVPARTGATVGTAPR
jgi:hypothetical protein